jgi:[ribosomal protein S18]-alanine N-acetyltransferase
MLALPDIRLATPADATGIADMSRDCIEHGLPWSWTAARVLQAIHDPLTNVAVHARRGQLQGFGIMQYGDDDAHLLLLAVSPVARHQGLGRGLTAWLEHTARTAGVRRIRLEARADNLHALAFYEKQGYVRVGTASGYYEGVVDAVQMRKMLVGDGGAASDDLATR